MCKKLDDRVKMVKAMEYIARQVNDERVFDYWLSLGVADGDIEYGDLSAYENLENDDAVFQFFAHCQHSSISFSFI